MAGSGGSVAGHWGGGGGVLEVQKYVHKGGRRGNGCINASYRDMYRNVRLNKEKMKKGIAGIQTAKSIF